MCRYIFDLLNHLNFEEDAIRFFETAYKKICGSIKSSQIFDSCIHQYEKTETAVYDIVYKNAIKIESLAGVDRFTVMMLFMLCFSRHLKVIYTRRGYSEKMYFDVLGDLACKNTECYTIKGVYGSFVSQWEFKIFNLELFAFGRLQFEPRRLEKEYKISTGILPAQSSVLSIHIPSSGRLETELCIDSVKCAQDFFGKSSVFYCHSWLLYPDNRKIITPPSNILKFMDLFEIVAAEESTDDLWRIFGTEDLSDFAALPENTSLRRDYKRWLLSGNKVGIATGFITDRRLKDE